MSSSKVPSCLLIIIFPLILTRCRHASSGGRADSILYADYHSSLYLALAVGFCPYSMCQFSALWSAPCLRLEVNYIYLYQNAFVVYKPFQRFGWACALGRVNRYPESCH